MIARIWRGWTAADIADEYAKHLCDVAVPALEAMEGNLGVYVLRRRLADGFEFQSLSVWESLEAMRQAEGAAGVPEDHLLLVGRQTIPARWEVAAAGEIALIAAA
jgi:antibiotic biosynthesis monooxygenase